jgi:hypothetical protein
MSALQKGNCTAREEQLTCRFRAIYLRYSSKKNCPKAVFLIQLC